MDSLSLLELNALVRRSLEQCLPDEYWIQAELDRGNAELEEVLMDIMFGESAQARLTTNILRGIYMSSNTRLHEAVGKLLVAAKLQEGLRKGIWENMDYVTSGACLTMCHVIKEN